METSALKEFVDGLRDEWRTLWRTRIDDRIRAEGAANRDYPLLFTERGTIIIATRDYKPPSFHEILQVHLPSGEAEMMNPSPTTGGIRRFIREVLRAQGSPARRRGPPPPRTDRSKGQQRKKGGRGWLHYP